MKSKTLITVTILVVTYSISTHGQLENVFTTGENMVTQAAKRLLDIAEAGLRMVTSDSLKSVMAATNPALEVAKDSASSAKNALDDIAGMVVGRVLEVQQKAQEVGEDISQCIEENQKRSSRVISEANESLEECVMAAAKEAIKPVKIISNITQFAISHFNEGSKEIVACAMRFQPISCTFEMIRQVESDIEDLMKQVTSEVEDVIGSAGSIGPTAMGCANKQVELARMLMDDVLSDIASCLNLPL